MARPSPRTRCTATRRAAGTTYYYAVTAINAKGESAQSTVVNATPATAPGVPTAPAATGNNASVALAWTAPAANGSAITAYKIYRGATSSSLSLLATDD